MATANDANDVPKSPPRYPGDYDDTPHYRDRVTCDRRPITKGLAREAVQRGDVDSNPEPRPNSWRFVNEVGGMRVAVVVGEDKYRPTLSKITAYVDVVDAAEAWSSERWSNDDVYVAALLQRLVGEHVPGLRPVRIDVTDPVPYHGHRLIWKDGHTDPYCIACRRRGRTKDEWEDRSCRE